MSFILDALKKAESERNRHIAPVLLDARIAPPRRGLPAWAWGLGAVLLVNLGLLLWILTRTPEAARSAENAAQSAQPSASGQATAPPAAAAATQSAAPTPAITPTVPVPVAIPSAVPAPVGVPAVAANPVAAPAVTVAPMPAPVSAAPPAITAGPSLSASDERLPGMQELRASGVPLPELVLNLHIYDPAPANRSVLLNGQRLREGEYTPDGVRLERITPDAVILEASGRRFRLGTAD